MNFIYKDKSFRFKRYPTTSNQSLRAWSAAEEHLLRHLETLKVSDHAHLAVYHDRFGFLTCLLEQEHDLTTIVLHKSQEKAIALNREENKKKGRSTLLDPLEKLSKEVQVALMKMPKSVELFQLYLYQLQASLAADGVVLVGFMTRHFSPKMLKVAELFFEEVEQSRAWKKSRVLVLRTKKEAANMLLGKTIDWGDNKPLQQYYGVFSGRHIDYASQFLLEHLKVEEGEKNILDVGAGNGVFAVAMRQQAPSAEIHLLDDSYLAIASSKLNIKGENTSFHWDDTLQEFKNDYFDLVVTNPPFHFEHENNIEVSLRLFWEVVRCLKPDGRFVLVANHHLNYQTHLRRMFPDVDIIAENEKFVIYECRK